METMFWSKLKALCAERGTTPTRVCKDAGLSTGSPPAWKRGALPTIAVRTKLADYFGVSPDYFVAETEKAPASEETGASEEAVRYSLFNGQEVSDETYQKVLAFARFALEEERRQKGE